MQVLYGEDIASYTAPEPCVLFREVQGEASAGDRAGWPLSRESEELLVADRVFTLEGNTNRHVIASGGSGRRGPRPQHAWTLLGREPGDLVTGQGNNAWSAWGRPDGRSPR